MESSVRPALSTSSESECPERCFIVVPAYNESQVIGEVVGDVCSAYPDTVVVDDGSTDDTAAKAEKAGATVVSHTINRGQGAALQTGLEYALRRGASYIITFDGDGQHAVEDIASLLAPLLAGKADVALGSRFIGRTENMPVGRRFLLKMAVAFTRLTSGLAVTDTHNGLRAFTRSAAEIVDIRLDRMAHATELMDQIRQAGMRFVEVPVHVRYTKYSRSKGQHGLAALRILFDYFIGRWMR